MYREIAQDFVGSRFRGMEGLLGVLLVGSASLGYTDEFSDIDLELVASDELFRSVGEDCGSEKHLGKDIWWEWMTLNELLEEIRDWREDASLWVYSKSTILYDSGELEKLLARYKEYPENVWHQKLFTYWYIATGHAPYDSGRAISRGDLLTAQFYLSAAMEYYTALVFVLNRSFVPYRKWRPIELDKLQYTPRDFREKLRTILTTKSWHRQEFKAKQGIVNGLATELEPRLLDAGLPVEKIRDPWKFKASYFPRI